jgi:hypothetical protein
MFDGDNSLWTVDDHFRARHGHSRAIDKRSCEHDEWQRGIDDASCAIDEALCAIHDSGIYRDDWGISDPPTTLR